MQLTRIHDCLKIPSFENQSFTTYLYVVLSSLIMVIELSGVQFGLKLYAGDFKMHDPSFITAILKSHNLIA